jgi:uncharacterized protein DUF3606
MSQPVTEILPDRYLVDLTKPWHLVWWAGHFGVSEEMLQTAISRVGTRAEAIRLRLDYEKHKSTVTDEWETPSVIK